MEEELIEIKDAKDWTLAEDAGRAAAQKLGLSEINQACLKMALQGAVDHVIGRAGSGSCTITDDSDAKRIRLKVAVEAPCVVRAPTEELSLVQKVVDEFTILTESEFVRVIFAVSQDRPGPKPAPAPKREQSAVIADFETRFAHFFGDNEA